MNDLRPAHETPGAAEVALTPELLHARYATRIDRHIRAVLGADHEREDLVHEVLIIIFRKIGGLRNPVCLDRWVSQITTNTLRYTMRQRRCRRHPSWEALSDRDEPPVLTDFDARELAIRAIRVMSRMRPSDRALLARYWLSPTTAVDIAAESGCSVITVRRRLFRARLRFEKLARLDPALARRLEDARARARRSSSATHDARGYEVNPDRFDAGGTSSAA